MDLAPTQPDNVPPNFMFMHDDIELDWEYEDNPFDYVYARFLAGAIKDWPRLMKQAYEYVYMAQSPLLVLGVWADCLLNHQLHQARRMG